MDVLTLVATCGLTAHAALFVPLGSAPACASATPVFRGGRHGAVAVWQPDIAAAAHRFDIPQAWIAAVMQAESDGQATVDGEPIRSPAGAMGLMQVMPQTYAALRARYGLGADPYAPRDNILAGAAYLRELLDRYGVPWFLAAYNAGPARLDAFLHTGRVLPVETQRYLAALAPQIDVTSGALRAAVVATESSTKPASGPPVRSPSDALSAGLFVTVVVHPEVSPARTVPPIVRPSQAPMAAPPEVTGGSATAGLEPRSVSESALNARGKSALFVALQ
ncbi:lytic transglycosylase domain-containing protein [Acidiphilium multivorum]|uniref:lytic transglycosylase domain-containing protein n=1 Tax=Acidiphilium multivorum TaxID=62140 RepID=UPI001B8D2717|nr:lytic transglycosylase domain-containing protein [Acidiphilium multivorum]MBS3024455.1 lytic transglycosylase domain-containing protein [Acidiphilium multivorum]